MKHVYNDPNWWTSDHSAAWLRAKTALRREWEQTRGAVEAGLGEGPRGDTRRGVKPSSPEPATAGADERSSWDEEETGLRFGYGARAYHGGGPWDEQLERELRVDWEAANEAGAWNRIKAAAKRGWHAAKRGR